MQNVVYKQSMLLFPGDFDALFDKLESIVVGIGKPGGSLKREGGSTLLSRVSWKSLKSGLSTFASTFRRGRWHCLLNTYVVFNYTTPHKT